MPETATDTVATETAATATDAGAGNTGSATAAATTAQATDATDWQAEAAKWKAIARQNEQRAKDNAAAAQTKAAQDEALAKVMKALGVDTTASQPDPAALAAQLEAAKAQNADRDRELAVLRSAARLGANGDELLDSRQFMASIKSIDPTKTDELADAIKAAVAASPARFALNAGAATATGTAQNGQQQAAAQHQTSTAASGSQFNGASGGQRQWTKEDVDRATPAEVNKAYKDGLLASYLAS